MSPPGDTACRLASGCSGRRPPRLQLLRSCTGPLLPAQPSPAQRRTRLAEQVEAGDGAPALGRPLDHIIQLPGGGRLEDGREAGQGGMRWRWGRGAAASGAAGQAPAGRRRRNPCCACHHVRRLASPPSTPPTHQRVHKVGHGIAGALRWTQGGWAECVGGGWAGSSSEADRHRWSDRAAHRGVPGLGRAHAVVGGLEDLRWETGGHIGLSTIGQRRKAGVRMRRLGRQAGRRDSSIAQPRRARSVQRRAASGRPPHRTPSVHRVSPSPMLTVSMPGLRQAGGGRGGRAEGAKRSP